MSIVFVRVRNDHGKLYDSYTDYNKLIDLSGFDRCELNEVEHGSDNVYIFLHPAECSPGI